MMNRNININTGDVLILGRYPQTEQENVLPIEWQVLDVEEDRVLVLSRYVLDAMPFHEEAVPVRWENCTLRSWLNSAFMDAAFSPEEQEAICAPETNEDPMGDFFWEMFGMETVTSAIEDRVFLLCCSDISQYYPELEGNTLFCPGASARFTPYAAQKQPEPCWWLRSSMARFAMAHIVSPADSVGMSVISADNAQGVRPAMWLRRSACADAIRPEPS